MLGLNVYGTLNKEVYFLMGKTYWCKKSSPQSKNAIQAHIHKHTHTYTFIPTHNNTYTHNKHNSDTKNKILYRPIFRTD